MATITAEKNSGTNGPHLLDRLQKLLPDSERIEIPGASHIMHEDNAAAYNAAVLSFLKMHRPTAPNIRQTFPVGCKP